MSRCGRAGRALAIAAAALVLVAAPRARAANSVQGTAEVGVGWTDNVFNAPQSPYAPLCDANGNCVASPPPCDPNVSKNCAAGAPLPRYSDFFFELRPGIAFTTGAARAVQRLAYNFSADLFVTHPQGNSYTNTLDWNGFFIPSKKTELMVGLQSQEGRINTLNLQNSADTTAIGVTSAATSTTFFSQGANEALVDHISNHWNFAQSLSFLAFIPLSPRTLPDTYTTTLDLGAERLWAIDALGVDLRSEYVVYGETRDANSDVVVSGLQQQIINSAVARWRRDWTHFWSTEAALGLIMAMNAADGSERIWQPYALAVGRYFNERGTGELRYEHNIVPNPLSGATFVADQVTLRLTVPFPEKTRLFFAASGGYEHAQLFNQDSNGGQLQTGLVATAEIALADASLTWQAQPWLGVFARYEFYRQFGHPSDLGFMQPNIERNIVLVGVAAIYPVAAAARVPNRPGLRVDRADMPMIPEPHSLPAPTH